MSSSIQSISGRSSLAHFPLLLVTGFTCFLSACSPTVKVEAPDKPIVINLNVKIEQEVRIRVEKEVEDLFSANPDIF